MKCPYCGGDQLFESAIYASHDINHITLIFRCDDCERAIIAQYELCNGKIYGCGE